MAYYDPSKNQIFTELDTHLAFALLVAFSIRRSGNYTVGEQVALLNWAEHAQESNYQYILHVAAGSLLPDLVNGLVVFVKTATHQMEQTLKVYSREEVRAQLLTEGEDCLACDITECPLHPSHDPLPENSPVSEADLDDEEWVDEVLRKYGYQ